MPDAARRRARLLVFVHIPKTAGTTLRAVLNMNEPGARSRALGNVFKGGGGISKALIERLRKDQGPDLSGVGLVRGHYPLGIREYLPKYLPKDREPLYFTFLRQPADRTLSHYFAIREYGRGYGLPPLPAEATLDDALEGGYIHDNVQTRMLSGLAEPFGDVTDEMLEQAKHNLRDDLAFFGLTERFDESLVLAKRRLGFRSILYTASGRVNTTRPRGDAVPAELLRAAERCNRYDLELYRYAEELFERAPERQELDFDVELAALRAAKAGGEVEVDVPAPDHYRGGEPEWRMLLEARATLLRLEFERRRHRIPHVSATMQDDALESDLKAARARTSKLEQQVERLEAARSRAKRLEQQVERLEAASSRAAELEREVERLKAASSRTKKLEQQAERLKTARSRNKKLQEEVERLKLASSRTQELEQEVESLKADASRTNELEQQLEQQLEQLDAARSRKNKLEQKVERLRAAAAARERQAAPVPPKP